MPESAGIEVNGRKLRVAIGTSVATVLFQAGEFSFRTSASGEPRAPLCGIGICFDCRVTIDGQANCRSCQIPIRDGMAIRTSLNKVDVLVIGAGPAGIAAATRAHASGARVAMVDDNSSAGGQIWRGTRKLPLEMPGIETIFGTQVIAPGSRERTLLLEDAGKAFELGFDKLILATGARELFLPFPGWTLPGVMGAGGLQALMKSGLQIRGKAVVIAGSGPLLLAVAGHLRKAGARIKLIAEQAAAKAVSSFAFHLIRYPAKVMQAAALKLSLAGVPYLPGCWVEAAEGEGRLKRVRLRQGRKSWMEDCDYAGIGYGLYPNTELASLLGCRLEANAIGADEWHRTSADDVFAAGECTESAESICHGWRARSRGSRHAVRRRA